MAIVAEKEKKNDAEVREAIAHVSAFYQKYEKKLSIIEDFLKDAKALRHEVVVLLNARDMLDVLNKQAAIEREKVEHEAQTRLSTVEQGHQALIDRLSKKEIELDSKMADIEKREVAAQNARREAELLKSAYDQKMVALMTQERSRK